MIIFSAPSANAVLNSSLTDKTDRSSLSAGKSCRCVAFRLDDVQDYFLTNVQIEVVNTLEKKNANLTVGIIGNSFGEDLFLVIFLKEKIARHNDGNSSFYLELANHGWNHEDFTLLDEKEQSTLINQTNEKIIHLLDVKPTVFIPPYNALNNDTMEALFENDIHYTSANATSYPPTILYEYENKTNATGFEQTNNSYSIAHFASAATTGDLNADNTEWLGYSHNETFTGINDSIDNLGYAVVTMHPMEFSLRNGTQYKNEIDREQIHELELLIDDIRAAGLRIVAISDIDEGKIVAVPEFALYVPQITLAISITVLILLSTRNKKDRLPSLPINSATIGSQTQQSYIRDQC